MKAAKHAGGRPKGPKMPCGWCGKPMTASDMRKHFTTCPLRPATTTAEAIARGAELHRRAVDEK